MKDYSIPNLVKRFQLTLVGREMLNGRPALVVDFKPLNDHLPVNQFADKFINQAAGRVWIDEADYAIAQAQIYLTEQVNVLGGLVGAVWKFTYAFTRAADAGRLLVCAQHGLAPRRPRSGVQSHRGLSRAETGRTENHRAGRGALIFPEPVVHAA